MSKLELKQRQVIGFNNLRIKPEHLSDWAKEAPWRLLERYEPQASKKRLSRLHKEAEPSSNKQYKYADKLVWRRRFSLERDYKQALKAKDLDKMIEILEDLNKNFYCLNGNYRNTLALAHEKQYKQSFTNGNYQKAYKSAIRLKKLWAGRTSLREVLKALYDKAMASKDYKNATKYAVIRCNNHRTEDHEGRHQSRLMLSKSFLELKKEEFNQAFNKANYNEALSIADSAVHYADKNNLHYPTVKPLYEMEIRVAGAEIERKNLKEGLEILANVSKKHPISRPPKAFIESVHKGYIAALESFDNDLAAAFFKIIEQHADPNTIKELEDSKKKNLRIQGEYRQALDKAQYLKKAPESELKPFMVHKATKDLETTHNFFRDLSLKIEEYLKLEWPQDESKITDERLGQLGQLRDRLTLLIESFKKDLKGAKALTKKYLARLLANQQGAKIEAHILNAISAAIKNKGDFNLYSRLIREMQKERSLSFFTEKVSKLLANKSSSI